MDENGCVKGARVIKMELGEPDASGRRSPVEIPGSEYEIEADTVIHVARNFSEPADFFHDKGT